MDPNTLLLVSSFKTIDLHYQYTKKEFSVSTEDDNDGEEEENGKGETYGEFLHKEEACHVATEFDNVTG